MAITATIVYAKANSMRILVSASAGSGESTPVLSANLLAGAAPGLLKSILNVGNAGYGKIAAGTTITQAMARALLMSDDAAAVVGPNIPTAIAQVQQRTGTGTITVDANQDALPTFAGLTVAAPAAGAATAYVDLVIPGAIGA